MRRKNIWFTSDWHLGATAEKAQHMRRPPDYEERIFDSYHDLVEPNDIVYFLGDMVNDHAEWEHVAGLNGIKVLCRGNYDREQSVPFLHDIFDEVFDEGETCYCPTYEFDMPPLAAQHYPTRSMDVVFNLVGHIHDRWKVQKNMLNVGVDVHHFRLVSLEDVKFYYDAIVGYYDADVWVANHSANVAHASRGLTTRYLA